MKKTILLFISCLLVIISIAQMPHNGIENNLGNIFRLSNAKTRSISPENYTGAKGKGGMAETGNAVLYVRVILSSYLLRSIHPYPG